MKTGLAKEGVCKWPKIIQGGMGVAVSNWSLARAVSLNGQMGVVSGTALDTVLIRRLQDGDKDGAMRRAIAAFPCGTMGEAVLRRWYRAKGRAARQAYALKPLPQVELGRREIELLMVCGPLCGDLLGEGRA